MRGSGPLFRSSREPSGRMRKESRTLKMASSPEVTHVPDPFHRSIQCDRTGRDLLRGQSNERRRRCGATLRPRAEAGRSRSVVVGDGARRSAEPGISTRHRSRAALAIVGDPATTAAPSFETCGSAWKQKRGTPHPVSPLDRNRVASVASGH